LESKILSSEEDAIQELNGRQSRLCNISLFNLADSNEKNDEISLKNILNIINIKNL